MVCQLVTNPRCRRAWRCRAISRPTTPPPGTWGKNAYTTVIANPLFASFTTTESKSRVNFLKLLRAPHEEYVWGEDAMMYYVESQGLSLCTAGEAGRAAATLLSA